MQQAVVESTQSSDVFPARSSGRVMISGEVLIYLIIIVFSLALRTADLDTVPIASSETHNALAAFHAAYPANGVEPLTSDSAVTFWLQRLAFTTFDTGEAGARVFTALAGVALGLLPLLFRDLLGRVRVFIMVILLTFSPVLLVDSRMSSDIVWAMLFAGIGLWALWRYSLADSQEESNNTLAVVAVISFTSMAFLAGPSGLMLALILLFAGSIALGFTSLDANETDETPPDDYLMRVRTRIITMPWSTAIPAALLTVFIVSTGFMFYPSGLSMVGETVGGFFALFTGRIAGAPAFFPLIASIFYEPWLWLLGGISLFLIIRRGGLTFVERFFIFWLIGGVFASIFMRGADADYALWLVVPLIGLVSYLGEDLLKTEHLPALWLDNLMEEEAATTSLNWSKWVLAIAGATLTFMFMLHLQIIARGFLKVSNGSLVELLSRLSEAPFALTANSLIWLLITLMFSVVGFFLAASIWGNGATLRGAGLGVLAFALMSGLATGWNTAVSRADDPVELWHIAPVTSDATMLRTMMIELDLREARGERELPIYVEGRSDSLIGWLLRDFPDVVYVTDSSAAYQQEVIILAGHNTEVDLGGSYVGRPISLTRVWSPSAVLNGFDFLPWLLSRDVRAEPGASDLMTLWVRQDVYDSVPYVPPAPEDNSVG
ncbi:MAG: hypothetical protein RLP44_27390 [Aggregatilineales bacterium]